MGHYKGKGDAFVHGLVVCSGKDRHTLIFEKGIWVKKLRQSFRDIRYSSFSSFYMIHTYCQEMTLVDGARSMLTPAYLDVIAVVHQILQQSQHLHELADHAILLLVTNNQPQINHSCLYKAAEKCSIHNLSTQLFSLLVKASAVSLQKGEKIDFSSILSQIMHGVDK